MYDPEDARKPPTTWREYLSQSKEMWGAIRWALREFKTPENVYWYRNLIGAVVFATAFSTFQYQLIATIVNGVSTHNLNLTVLGTVGFLSCQVINRIIDNRHAVAREHLFGINMGQLDSTVSRRFFDKSLGQHVEESDRLNPDSIMTGRERLLSTQGLLLFEGVPTIVGLIFSYLLLWIRMGHVVGSTMTAGMAGYTLYLLFLNQRVLERGTPIEVGWRALKRYRVERMKCVERVKTSAKETAELQTMWKRFLDLIKQDLALWLWYIKHTFWRGIVLLSAFAVVVIYGIHQAWIGHWLLGALVPLIMWSLEIVNNMWRIGHIERELNWFMPSVRHMIEALNIPPKIVSKPNAVVITKNDPITVSFEAITHAYPLENDSSDNENGNGHIHKGLAPVLKNVTFTIKPGERVALIGPSGAGKTTLMTLLLRFMDPEHGTIRVNGHDLRDIDHESWLRTVAYIPQFGQIFDGSIRDNLTYALSPEEVAEWTDERLWELMRTLRIDFGERLHNGLDTVVGERGIKLSGGQAQRVMIGAAAIQHPPFMIIDEATSHLDSSTELAVHDGIQKILSGHVSALIIAHRLSTVRDLCDWFVVLRNPEEVANGDSQVEAIARSFEELYVISPTFRQLADDQHVVIAARSAKV